MATLPVQLDPTLAAIAAEVERRAAAEPERPYLGMSSIGRDCERQLWYSFRWAVREAFDCGALWRFEDGHRTEDVLADRLRLVPGVHLRTIDPRTGQQFAFVDLGGHFRGHADGMVEGILQAPATLHVWEAKATNDKKLAELEKLKAEVGEKAALAKWDTVYHAQAILYMAYSETTRHYLTASTPGGRVMASARTNTDLDEARRLRAKAERIIAAPEPLTKLSDDPSWYQCRWCPAADVCHRGAMPAVNCRTCAHSTPEMDGNGRWSCAHHRRDVTVQEQREGCQAHRFIPALVTFAEAIDADPAANWIEYRTADGQVFRNGEPAGGAVPSLSSHELRTGLPAIGGATDPIGQALRDDGARIVHPDKPFQPPVRFGRAA